MEKTKVTCKHCGHSWKTTAETALVTCAGCGLKTKNIEIKRQQSPHSTHKNQEY